MTRRFRLSVLLAVFPLAFSTMRAQKITIRMEEGTGPGFGSLPKVEADATVVGDSTIDGKQIASNARANFVVLSDPATGRWTAPTLRAVFFNGRFELVKSDPPVLLDKSGAPLDPAAQQEAFQKMTKRNVLALPKGTMLVFPNVHFEELAGVNARSAPPSTSSSGAVAVSPLSVAVASGDPLIVTEDERIDSFAAAPGAVFHGKVVFPTSLVGSNYGQSLSVPKGAIADFVIRQSSSGEPRLALAAIEVDGKTYPVTDAPLLPINSQNIPLRPSEIVDSHESITGHVVIRGFSYFRLNAVMLAGGNGSAEASSSGGHDPASFDVLGVRLMMSGKEALAALEAHTHLKAQKSECNRTSESFIGSVGPITYCEGHSDDASNSQRQLTRNGYDPAPDGWTPPNYITRIVYSSPDRNTSVTYRFIGAMPGASDGRKEYLVQIDYGFGIKTVADREQFYDAILAKYGEPRFKHPVNAYGKNTAYVWCPEGGDLVQDFKNGDVGDPVQYFNIPLRYPYMEMIRAEDSSLNNSSLKLVASPKYKQAYDAALAKSKKEFREAEQKKVTTKKPDI